MNEIRNELLLLRNMELGKEENRNFYIEQILERFQYDIEQQLEDLKHKEKELMQNMEIVKQLQKELIKKEGGK